MELKAKHPLRLSKGSILIVYKTDLHGATTKFLVLISRFQIRLVPVDLYRTYCRKDYSDQ